MDHTQTHTVWCEPHCFLALPCQQFWMNHQQRDMMPEVIREQHLQYNRVTSVGVTADKYCFSHGKEAHSGTGTDFLLLVKSLMLTLHFKKHNIGVTWAWFEFLWNKLSVPENKHWLLIMTNPLPDTFKYHKCGVSSCNTIFKKWPEMNLKDNF